MVGTPISETLKTIQKCRLKLTKSKCGIIFPERSKHQTTNIMLLRRAFPLLRRRPLLTRNYSVDKTPFILPAPEHDSDYDSDRFDEDNPDAPSFLLDIPVVDSEEAFTRAVLDEGVHRRDSMLIPESLGAVKPVIWRGRLCNAMALWAQPEYLEQKVPSDLLCEVEWGSYCRPTSERMTVPFEAYYMYLQQAIGRFGTVEKEQIMYMAQNDLPKELYDDLGTMPSFLGSLSANPVLRPHATTADANRRKLYNVNWWVGPAGCRSPLHFDPLDNILMQITGQKKVWLIRPTVFCYNGLDELTNTSVVDVHDKDVPDYPAFKTVPCRVATLCPGDVLFIPAKWWHATRSTNSSAWSLSVNAWWR